MPANLTVVLLLVTLVALLCALWRLRRAQTSARDALAKVQSSERFFADSFHNNPVPCALANLKTQRIAEVNDAFIRLIDRSREQLIGKGLGELGLTSSTERERLYRRMIRSGLVRNFVTRLERKDGSVRDVTLSLDFLEVAGEPHAIHTLIDQTDHKRAVAALRQTDERMRELAKATDEVFYISSPDRLTLHYISPAYENMWGRPVASVYADPMTMFEAIIDEDRKRIADEIAKPYTSEFRVLEFCITRLDGNRRWIRMKESQVRDGSGARVGRVAGVATDLTEQRVLEDQLRQAQKMESLGMLAGGVAHDFNNLLAVISSCNGLLAEAVPPDSSDHELVEDISQAVVRASALTRQLLAFSRKHVAEAVVLDLNTVVTDTRKLLRRLVGGQIEVLTSLDPEVRRIRMDRGQLVQVVLNLAVNARDAMPDGGTLTLASRNIGDMVCVEIIDTGTGMPPEVVARACEPFFTTKEQGKGSGMGLAVVHGIVDQAGGKMEIESKQHVGTTIRIHLPACEGTATVARATADANERGVETILIVDDDEYVRRATARALRNRGYTVHEASSGHAALAALATGLKFDLMLSDIMMPNMNGRVLAERVRVQFPEVRILMMTGYTDDETVRIGVAAGEVDLIEKPFTIPSLAAKVRDMLDAEVPMRPTRRLDGPAQVATTSVTN